MKKIVKFMQIRYFYLFIAMTLLSSASLGSRMSQFAAGKPVYLLDKCSRTIGGYSMDTSTSLSLLFSFVFSTPQDISVVMCSSNTYYYSYSGGTGAWLYSGGTPTSNCYSSSKYCFFKNDNY